jgi:hypothetical protein
MVGMHKLKRFKAGWRPHHIAVAEVALSLIAVVVVTTMPTSAVIRFQHRSLMINSSLPGAVTTYTLSMQYVTQIPIGSVDMLFCIDPIPQDPCVPPPGLDVSQAVLSSQTGETGFNISQRTSNHLVLSRNPSVPVADTQSTYVFENIRNPNYTEHSYSIRLADFASTDATGTVVDLGSVVTQANDSIELETQVPPILVFCLAQGVSADCSSINGGNYTDFGNLDPNNTLATQSQMGIGTNASAGYVVTVNGASMASGTSIIPALAEPTPSKPRTNQFGINLVANDDPQVGKNPDGASLNAVAAPEYSQPNKYLFRDGDVIASAPNVSLIRRFTVSYIVNADPDLKAGVYTTTVTFICSGRF